QGLHGLLDGSVGVPAVNLVQVDVVGAQAAQGGIDGGHDVLAGQAAVVGAVAHGQADLGGQHVVVTVGEDPRQDAAGDLLAGAAAVDVGGVEEGDPGVGGAADEGFGAVLRQHPVLPSGRVAVAHHAQADTGHLHAGGAKPYVLHVMPFPERTFPLAR